MTEWSVLNDPFLQLGNPSGGLMRVVCPECQTVILEVEAKVRLQFHSAVGVLCSCGHAFVWLSNQSGGPAVTSTYFTNGAKFVTSLMSQ